MNKGWLRPIVFLRLKVLLDCRRRFWTELKWLFGAFWGRMRLSWKWLLREWSWFQRLPYSDDGSKWLRFSSGGPGKQSRNSRPYWVRITREWRQPQKWTISWNPLNILYCWIHKSSKDSSRWLSSIHLSALMPLVYWPWNTSRSSSRLSTHDWMQLYCSCSN